MIQLAGISSGGSMQVQLPDGSWKMKWINPSSGDEVHNSEISADASSYLLKLPAGPDHLVIVLNKLN